MNLLLMARFHDSVQAVRFAQKDIPLSSEEAGG
jgi:hypothetical protein